MLFNYLCSHLHRINQMLKQKIQLKKPDFSWIRLPVIFGLGVYFKYKKIASNPKTLEELIKSIDRKTLRALAGDPNSPIELLWLLMKYCPYQVINNPVFQLTILEQPNWIMEIPKRDLHELIQQQEAPGIVLKEAVYHCNHYTQEIAIKLIAKKPQTTACRLVEITLYHGHLYLEVIQNTNINWQVIQDFATCHNQSIQEELACFCFLPLSQFPEKFQDLREDILWIIIQDLIDNHRDTVKISLLKNKYFPSKYIQPLISSLPYELHRYLAKSSSVSVQLLAKLAYNNSVTPHIYQLIAINPKTPSKILEEFAEYQSKAVLISLAARSDLSPDLFVKLATNSSPGVRYTLLNNCQIKSSFLREFRSHPQHEVRTLATKLLLKIHLQETKCTC
jgi:hypothetical protein